MASFTDISDWHGYKITARPKFWLHRHMFKVLRTHWFAPFMNDSELYIRLTVKPRHKRFIGGRLQLSWVFENTETTKVAGSGSFFLTKERQSNPHCQRSRVDPG